MALMLEFDFLKLLIRTLVLPPGGILLVLVASLMQWQLRPRFAKVLAVLGVVLLWLAATPWVARAYESLLTDGIEVLDLRQARAAQAIVIPGAGRLRAPEYDGLTLSRLSLERVRYGARLAKRTGLPVLVTGGAGDSPHTEAELMQAVLASEYAVLARWVENRSANTRENAAESARLLRPRDRDGAQRIVLVAHGFDIYRATKEFEAVGFEVLPAPTHLGSLRLGGISDLLPSPSGLERTHYVSYELLALGLSALSSD